jgi:hypothetical protein
VDHGKGRVGRDHDVLGGLGERGRNNNDRAHGGGGSDGRGKGGVGLGYLTSQEQRSIRRNGCSQLIRK